MYRIACAAPNCRMRTYDFSKEQSKLAKSNYVVSFHKFPADTEKKNAWIKAAKKPDWNPTENSCLCSLHFKDDSFNENNQLFEHAVPTIFFTDFRGYIKDLIENVKLEVDLESDSGDDDDILRKSLKGIYPEISENTEEIMEYEIDEFEIECEEVILSEAEVANDSSAQSSTSEPLTSTSKTTDLGIVASDVDKFSQKSSGVTKTPPADDPVKFPVRDLADGKTFLKAAPDPQRSIPESKNASVSNTALTKKSTPTIGLKNIKTKELPATPSETAKKLFSMIQSGSFNKFSVMQPASRSLVCQLLNIVKLANAQNAQNGLDVSVPNTYIITTKQESKDPEMNQNIVSMETSEIVSMITKTAQSIKDGAFEKSENVSIICGSPAIFLIKNVIVKNFDRNMNSVYVITTENLLPYLYQLSTKVGKKLEIPATSSGDDEISPSASVASSSPTSTSASTSVKTSSQDLQTNAKSKSLNSQTTATTARNLPKNIKTTSQNPLTNTEITSRNLLTNTVAASQNSKTNQCSLISRTSTNEFKFSPPKIPDLGISKDGPSSSPKITVSVNSASVSTPSLLNVNSMRQKLNSAIQEVAPVTSSGQAVVQLNLGPIQGGASISVPVKNLNFAGTPTFVAGSETGGPKMVRLNLAAAMPKSFVPGSNSLELKIASPAQSPNSSQVPNKVTAPQMQSVQSVKQYSSKIPASVPPPVFTVEDNPPGDTLNRGDIPQKRKLETQEDPSASDSAAPERKRILDVDLYLRNQRNEIEVMEKNILRKEREILSLKKKIQMLKKRYLAVKNPSDTKSDEQFVEEILNKYLDSDAVQFFVGQMKVSGKTYTQFRWSEEDKLFALGLLYKNPVDYHVLFERFTLPSDKTLSKFVSKVKKAEQSVKK